MAYRQQRPHSFTSQATAAAPAWTPFAETDNWADVFRRHEGLEALPVSSAEERINAHFQTGRFFTNNRYAVILVEMPMPAGPDAIHLLMMPRDNQPGGSWADLQRIKDEIVGADIEMYQVYPAASEMVDKEHTYHLWGYRDASWRLPLGLDRALHASLHHDFETADGNPVRGLIYIPADQNTPGG